MTLKMTLLILFALLFCCQIHAFRTQISGSIVKKLYASTWNGRNSQTALFGARNRAWAKGDLSDKDIFEDSKEEDGTGNKKDKYKLEPETVFFEGPPSASEVFLPALSILTVIG
jgi:hypothetical protein